MRCWTAKISGLRPIFQNKIVGSGGWAGIKLFVRVIELLICQYQQVLIGKNEAQLACELIRLLVLALERVRMME